MVQLAVGVGWDGGNKFNEKRNKNLLLIFAVWRMYE